LLLGVVVNKFFCRYLCPLGAALALLGRLRRFDWIARRAECGQPCQTCRYRCTYQAIEPDGRVQYEECFQCMDCVAIHDSVDECAPLLLEAKRQRVVPIHPLAAATKENGS
jgi:NosR/NirI family nitrous oxide reductase transcriptional regulator